MRMVVLLAFIVLAGCASTPSPAPGPAPQPVPLPVPVVAMSGCPSLRGIACFEPSVAIDSGGRIFVASTSTRDSIAVSTDEGLSFEKVPAPPLPQLAPPGAIRGDMTFQPDGEGRMYASALVFRSDVPLGQGVAGLQVARTVDGGASWDVNTYLTLPQGATGSDRQWLAFGDGGVMYLVYWQWFPGASSWVARSTDEGKTFGRFSPSNPIFAGVPSVTEGGRLLVPFFGARPATTNGRVQVAVSADGGASFRDVLVHDGGAWPGRWPVSARAPDGAMVLAWRDAEGAVLVARSTDEGDSWSEPATWSRPDEQAVLPPWVEPTADGLALLWYSGDKDGQHVVLARGTGPANATYVTVGHIDETTATTDFAQLDVGSDGRIAAAWTDPDDGIYVVTV